VKLNCNSNGNQIAARPDTVAEVAISGAGLPAGRRPLRQAKRHAADKVAEEQPLDHPVAGPPLDDKQADDKRADDKQAVARVTHVGVDAIRVAAGDATRNRNRIASSANPKKLRSPMP
jgi:hypothetical protein